MSNLSGLFRQFVSTIANSAGGFVNAFDNNGDSIVLKAEFQANMSQNKADWVGKWNGEESKYNDLIDSFWSSFDNIYEKGKINDTRIQNAYALDKAEANKIETQMTLFYKIAQIQKLSGLKQYINTYNYIASEMSKVITVDSNGNITSDVEATFDNLLKDMIKNNDAGLKDAILRDALAMVVKNINYTTVDGYAPETDAELLKRLQGCISSLVIGNGADPATVIAEYFQDTTCGDFLKIESVAKVYLNDNTKADPTNNYQIARLTSNMSDYLEDIINTGCPTPKLEGELLKRAQAKGAEAIERAVVECLENNSTKTINELCNDALNYFNSTEAGKDYNTYLYALSLGDFNKTEDEEFYNYLVQGFIDEGNLEVDANTIVEALSKNSKNNKEYLDIVEFVANLAYDADNNMSKQDIWKLIMAAIINGGYCEFDENGEIVATENGVTNSIYSDLLENLGIVEKSVTWLQDKIWVVPNTKKDIDVVNFYVDGANSTKDVTYNVTQLSTTGSASAAISIDNNGIVSIVPGASEGNIVIKVEALYKGQMIETKEINIEVSSQRPDWYSGLEIDNWAKQDSYTTAEAYTNNKYEGEKSVRETLRTRTLDTINDLYQVLTSEAQSDNNYNADALSYAHSQTTEFFNKLIPLLKAHEGVDNTNNKKPGWDGKAEFNLGSGVHCTVDYNQESHQGYIGADKNRFFHDPSTSSDNIEWIRGTMAGARFAKIGIKNSFISKVFNLFYERYLSGDTKSDISL